MTDRYTDALPALQAAAELIKAGVPIFLARAARHPDGTPDHTAHDPSRGVVHGHILPSGWQRTVPDLGVLASWQPGDALCAVQGYATDVIDIDSHKGGSASLEALRAEGAVPPPLAISTTPSGGLHLWISSTGCGSHDGLRDGVDVKAGREDGTGRGFVFLPPTERLSKGQDAGEVRPYRWLTPPSAETITTAQTTDETAKLALLMSAKHALLMSAKHARKAATPAADVSEERVREYCERVLEGLREELAEAAEWPEGHADHWGRGWDALIANAAYRVAGVCHTPGSGHSEADAETLFAQIVPPVMWETEGYRAADKLAHKMRTAPPIEVPARGIEVFGLTGQHAGTPWSAEQEAAPGLAGTTPTEPYEAPPLGVFESRTMEPKDLGVEALQHASQTMCLARNTGVWYRRAETHWETTPMSLVDGARVLLDVMADCTPRGQAGAEQGTPEKIQADRWARFGKPKGRGEFAAMVRDSALRMGIDSRTLDADPYVLWAGGWCWDLRASRERPVLADVSPETVHAHSAAVMPRDVPTPRWDALLAAVLPDEELRRYLWGVLGAVATGTSNRVMLVLYGRRGRGKSTLLRLIDAVLGTYADTLDPDILHPRTASDFKAYALKGLRLGWIDEGPSEHRAGQERLKALTGGAPIRGAIKHKQPETFAATHTLALTDNRAPDVADPALRSRVRAICVDAADKDAVRTAARATAGRLDQWLVEEGPGVLWQMIVWASRYLADDAVATPPADVQARIEELAREQDPILSWLDERVQDGGPTTSADLWSAYKIYADNLGIPKANVGTMHAWGRALAELGYPPFLHGPHRLRARALELRNSGGLQGWQGPTSGPAEEGESGGESYESFGRGESFRKLSDSVPLQGESLRKLSPPQSSHLSSHLETPSQGDKRELRELRELSPMKIIDRSKEGRKKDTRAGARGSHPDGTPLEAPAGAYSVDRVELPAIKRRGHDKAPEAVPLDEAAQAVDSLLAETVTLDVEHTGYAVGHRLYRMKTAQVGTAEWALILDASDPAQMELAVQAVDGASEIVAHSATADISLLAGHVGRDPDPWWRKTSDTAILAAMHDPSVTGLHESKDALGLKPLSERLLPDAQAPEADRARAAHYRAHKWLTNTTPSTPPERNGWLQVDPASTAMVTYAASDVLDTGALRAVLPTPPADLLARERTVQRITARLPERGLPLDAARVEELAGEHETKRDAAAQQLQAAGIDNPGSTVQVGQALEARGARLPRTKTGRLSTTADTVEQVAEVPGPAQELARQVLEWRSHDKLLGTYLAGCLEQVRHGDGRMRPTILTMGAAATGRMSSVRPNIQQVPRPTKVEQASGGGMRGMYVADPGMRIISADFSSVEVRIAAALAGDATLAHMVREGIDLHGEIVKLAWGLSPEDSSFGDIRYRAKRTVFAYLYGAGMARLRTTLGEHADKVDAVKAALRQLTPQLVEWDAQARRLVETGEVRYVLHPSGRPAWFDSRAPHKTLNTLVQGRGRELLVDALLRWEQMHPGQLIWPIHDEIVAMVPEQHAEEWTRDLVMCMTTTIGEGDCQVPIVAEADKPTRRWGCVE